MPADTPEGATVNPFAKQNRTEELAGCANQLQIGGDNYQTMDVQPWDFIIANGMGFLEGNIVKYLVRYKDKNGLDDLRKARHYLDKLIEVEEARRNQ